MTVTTEHTSPLLPENYLRWVEEVAAPTPMPVVVVGAAGCACSSVDRTRMAVVHAGKWKGAGMVENMAEAPPPATLADEPPQSTVMDGTQNMEPSPLVMGGLSEMARWSR